MNAVDRTKAGVASGDPVDEPDGRRHVRRRRDGRADHRPGPATGSTSSCRSCRAGARDKLADVARRRRRRARRPAGPRRAVAGRVRLRAEQRPARSAPRSRSLGALVALAADRRARPRRPSVPASADRGAASPRRARGRGRRRRAERGPRRVDPPPRVTIAAPDAGPRPRRRRAASAGCARRGEFFWLDLDTPSRRAAHASSASIFGLPRRWRSRTRRSSASARSSTTTATALLLVFYGAQHEDGRYAPVEVHIHLTRRVASSPSAAGRCAPLERRPARIERDDVRPRRTRLPRPRRADRLVLPVLQRDRRAEVDAPRGRRCSSTRRSRPARGACIDAASASWSDLPPGRRAPARHARRGADVLERLPGLERRRRRTTTFRDVYDHLVRSPSKLDRLLPRAASPSALDVYLQATSQPRSTRSTTRLTVVATIFLPLTFVTGFFGQNFGWLVDHIDSLGGVLGLRRRRHGRSPS